jgi:hypothetical protein
MGIYIRAKYNRCRLYLERKEEEDHDSSQHEIIHLFVDAESGTGGSSSGDPGIL